MIKEYAVEPKGMNSYQVIMNIANLFSVHEGRFISRFPSIWLKLVYNYVENLPDGLKKERVKQRLAEFRIKRILIKTNRTFENNLNWIENVRKQQENLPFYAVITKNETDIHNSLTFTDTFDEEHPLMKVDRTPRVKRTAKEMAKAVTNLLQFSKHIVFIDPHFEKLNKRHINPFIEFLNVIFARKNATPIQKIEYHSGSDVDKEHFIREYKRKVLRKLPDRFEIDFIRWPSEKLHNRYILTDLAGVSFGIGLDEDMDGSKPYDEIILLSYETYKKLWDFYIMNSNNDHLEKFSI